MSELLTEVVPGIRHWSATHPNHGMLVHSSYLPEQRAAIDPIGADGLLDELEEAGGVEQVILTCRHHLRASAEIGERFGAALRCPAAGIHQFQGADTPGFIAFEWGDEVVDGVTAHEVGSLSPDDGALHIAIGPGALALADSVMVDGNGLGFVPDSMMDDPEETKAGLLRALERLVDLDWDVLLMAHGPPIPAGGREVLRAFIESPRSGSFD